MKLLFALPLLSLLLLPCLLNSTCIVIIKTANAVFVAADTRSTITVYTEKGNSIITYKTIEKINHVGKYYFAISGHADQALLKEALKIDTNKSIVNNAKSFGERMKLFYLERMQAEKEKSPKQYNEWLNNYLCEVAFFSNINGKPNIVKVTMKLKEIKGIINVSYQIHENQDVVILGARDHIEKLSDSQWKKLIDKDYPEVTSAKLVMLEMNYHSEVACPLDILTWISNPVIKRIECK